MVIIEHNVQADIRAARSHGDKTRPGAATSRCARLKVLLIHIWCIHVSVKNPTTVIAEPSPEVGSDNPKTGGSAGTLDENGLDSVATIRFWRRVRCGIGGCNRGRN